MVFDLYALLLNFRPFSDIFCDLLKMDQKPLSNGLVIITVNIDGKDKICQLCKAVSTSTVLTWWCQYIRAKKRTCLNANGGWCSALTEQCHRLTLHTLFFGNGSFSDQSLDEGQALQFSRHQRCSLLPSISFIAVCIDSYQASFWSNFVANICLNFVCPWKRKESKQKDRMFLCSFTTILKIKQKSKHNT